MMTFVYGYNDTGLESINGLGFSLNPVKAVKKVGRGIAKGAKGAARGVARGTVKVGRGAAKGAVFVAKTAAKPVVAVSEFAFRTATAPLRNRVHALRDGRARKLAQIRRGSNTPNAAEKREAVAWTKSKLKRGGPQGYLLALFAGASPDITINGFGMSTNLGFDPATTSVILASLPPLTLLLNNVLKKAGAAGEIASQTAQAYAASNIPGYQPNAPVPSAAQYAQQAAASYIPPAAQSYVPPAQSYSPPASPYESYSPPPDDLTSMQQELQQQGFDVERTEAPMEGYFGAVPSGFKTGALITGLALVSGTGVFFALKRKRRRRRR